MEHRKATVLAEAKLIVFPDNEVFAGPELQQRLQVETGFAELVWGSASCAFADIAQCKASACRMFE